MKVIKVDSCGACPYLKYESSGRENYYCQKSYKILAWEGQIVTRESVINPITMEVIPERREWSYLLPDESAEWNIHMVSDGCPLEDA